MDAALPMGRGKRRLVKKIEILGYVIGALVVWIGRGVPGWAISRVRSMKTCAPPEVEMFDRYTALPYKERVMQAVVETNEYLRRARQCGISDEEREEIVDFIAGQPTAGDEISGTGGARKVRFARPGQGKSGGYRVITFFSGPDIPVFLITVFAKNEKANISKAERNALKKILGQLANDYRSKRAH